MDLNQACQDCNRKLDYIIVGVVMIILGAFGCTINTIAIFHLLKTPLFHSSFGYICASHLVADTGVLVIHVLWAGPATILELDLNATASIEIAAVGQFALLFWTATLYSQVQIAINRLVAIAWPTMYKVIFSGRMLAVYISTLWIVAELQSLPYYWKDCRYFFDVHKFSWSYRDNDCGRFASFYLDLIPSTTACILVFLIHTATFFCVRKKIKIMLRTTAVHSREQLLLLKKNIRFYIQGLLTAITLVSIVIFFHVISIFATNRWEYFLSTTLVWLIAHVIDGLIIIFFNKPFRSRFWNSCSKFNFSSHKTVLFVTGTGK